METVCIIGGGAIGGLITYYLYMAGLNNVTVYYGSRESIEEINKSNGLIVVYNNVEYLIPINPRHYSEPSDVCKYVVNAVKAYNVENTIDLMRRITNKDSLIIMVQNGFGSLELVEEKLYDRLVGCGVVFIGAERVSRNKIVHRGGNTIIAGCRRESCRNELESLAKLFRKTDCEFRVVDDIDLYRWVKLGLNAVVNPITAITLSRNKIILTKPGLELARVIINEVVEAASRMGCKLDFDRLFRLVIRNIENVAENYSSMVQDLLCSGRTEIDYINGYVAGILGENSINALLTKIIHLIEESNRINRKKNLTCLY